MLACAWLWLPGCVSQLDKDWLALTHADAVVVNTLLDIDEVDLLILEDLVEQYGNSMTERAQAEITRSLDIRTQLDPDGIPRLYARNPADPEGPLVPVSRADVDALIAATVQADNKVREKLVEYEAHIATKRGILAKVRAAKAQTVATAEDIVAAKESAQRVANEVTAAFATLIAAIAGCVVTGG